MRTAPVFAEGDVCRVRNMRGVFKIVEFNLVRGEVTLWGGLNGRVGYRYVTTDRLLPARKGDVVPGVRRQAS